MSERKEKSIRVKLTGEDVTRFEEAKRRAEQSTGVRLTDVAFVRGLIKMKIG